MRWGRNQSNAWSRMTDATDPIVYLMTRELSSFSGFRALRHFYLKLFCIGEVITGYTKSPGGYLFNRGIFPIAIFFSFETHFIFTTFTTIALPSNPIHRNRQRAVGFM